MTRNGAKMGSGNLGEDDSSQESFHDSHREQWLADQLDQHLTTLERGQSTAELDDDAELAELVPVLQRLYRVSSFLSGSVAGDAFVDVMIAKYEIRECLGSGGQSVVMLAFDPDLRRDVVLKLYHAVDKPGGQEAVLNEGRALVQVRSPFVAQCYGAERHKGLPYLILEYVPGRSLAEIVKDDLLNHLPVVILTTSTTCQPSCGRCLS